MTARNLRSSPMRLMGCAGFSRNTAAQPSGSPRSAPQRTDPRSAAQAHGVPAAAPAASPHFAATAAPRTTSPVGSRAHVHSATAASPACVQPSRARATAPTSPSTSLAPKESGASSLRWRYSADKYAVYWSLTFLPHTTTQFSDHHAAEPAVVTHRWPDAVSPDTSLSATLPERWLLAEHSFVPIARDRGVVRNRATGTAFVITRPVHDLLSVVSGSHTLAQHAERVRGAIGPTAPPAADSYAPAIDPRCWRDFWPAAPPTKMRMAGTIATSCSTTRVTRVVVRPMRSMRATPARRATVPGWTRIALRSVEHSPQCFFRDVAASGDAAVRRHRCRLG